MSLSGVNGPFRESVDFSRNSLTCGSTDPFNHITIGNLSKFSSQFQNVMGPILWNLNTGRHLRKLRHKLCQGAGSPTAQVRTASPGPVWDRGPHVQLHGSQGRAGLHPGTGMDYPVLAGAPTFCHRALSRAKVTCSATSAFCSCSAQVPPDPGKITWQRSKVL